MQSRLAELEDIRGNSDRFTLVQPMILSGKPTVPVGEEIERTKEVIAKERAAGYRLAYNAGASPSFELLRFGRSGERRLATHDRRVNLEDNYRHRILFVRDESGGMSLSADGKTLVQVRIEVSATRSMGLPWSMTGENSRCVRFPSWVCSKGTTGRAASRRKAQILPFCAPD